MGEIAVHEFMSLDGVFEDPSWTFDHGFVPEMGETMGAITGASTAILLGRRTYEMFAPAWSTRTVDDDPGAPFFNDTHKYVVASQQPSEDWGPSSVRPSRTSTGDRRPASAATTRTRSARSRTTPTARSSPLAAAPWSGRCCTTA